VGTEIVRAGDISRGNMSEVELSRGRCASVDGLWREFSAPGSIFARLASLSLPATALSNCNGCLRCYSSPRTELHLSTTVRVIDANTSVSPRVTCPPAPCFADGYQFLAGNFFVLTRRPDTPPDRAGPDLVAVRSDYWLRGSR